MKKILFIAAFIVFVASIGAMCDSIWDRTSTSPYSVNKSFRVGDLITIIVLENTNAAQKAETDTNVSDSFAANFNHTLAFLGIDAANSVSGDTSNQYKGNGATTRSSNVTAKVASVVTKVMPNGNLMISGEHRVEVNNELQTIKVTGMIRPKDVSLANTVYSYQVAAADISIRGKGAVGDASEPGWLTRLYNWIF
jgi:flagellar L-ring protein FlgH